VRLALAVAFTTNAGVTVKLTPAVAFGVCEVLSGSDDRDLRGGGRGAGVSWDNPRVPQDAAWKNEIGNVRVNVIRQHIIDTNCAEKGA
jgi:hypothetical protein